MPVDGTTPVRTRSGVRTLLGMPESAVAAVLSPVPMPPLEFSYVMSPSSAERHAPDQALADVRQAVKSMLDLGLLVDESADAAGPQS